MFIVNTSRPKLDKACFKGSGLLIPSKVFRYKRGLWDNTPDSPINTEQVGERYMRH